MAILPSSRTTQSSSSPHWQQSSDQKSNRSWDSWQTSSWTELACLKLIISWRSTGGVDRHTKRAPHFLMHKCCAVSLQSCCQSVQSNSGPRSTLSAFRPKTFTPNPRRTMSYVLQNLAPRPGTPSSPFPESVFQRAEQPCGDQRPQQSGALTELPPLTGCKPNRIAEDRENRHFTRDGQFTEHEDLRVRLLSFHQSIIASTCDSAESIATPPESDFDDEQLRALLASPHCTCRSEEQVQNDRKFITLNEKT